MLKPLFYFIVFFCLVNIQCKHDASKVDTGTVIIRLAAEPEQVDPLLARTLADRQLNNLLFLTLLDHDPQSLELLPVLAESLPTIDSITTGPWKGGIKYDFTIHKDATWDNGTPVTGVDYIFTFKTLLNPGINAAPFRVYFNFLKDIIVDPIDTKKFTVITDRPYTMALEALGTVGLYPEYFYDKNQLIKDISITDLTDAKRVDSIYQNTEALQKFAENFNNKNTHQTIGGSAYKLTEWITNQRIVLTKKKEHWTEKNPRLASIPSELIFKIIPDANSALSLLYNQELDVLTGIPPDRFDIIKTELAADYHFYTPPKLSYDYIGINGNQEKLANSNLRRALTHLVDVERAITETWNGLAQRTIGPIHPSKSYYHQGLPPILFDPIRADSLLKVAGFGSNKPTLKLRYFYNIKNEKAEEIGLLLKKTARALNIEIIITGMEIKALLTTYRKRDYDLIYLKWTTPPGLDDLRQTWHSSSNVAGGSNRTGFGDKNSDQLIDQIRISYDSKTQKELYLRIQEVIYQAQPYIFLYTPLERMAIHKRFTMHPTARYPGYTIAKFK